MRVSEGSVEREHGFKGEELAKRSGKTTALDGVSLAGRRVQVPGWQTVLFGLFGSLTVRASRRQQ